MFLSKGFRPGLPLRYLSNYDDNGNKKIVLHALHALHVHFSLIDISQTVVLVLSTPWNDLFCNCVDDVSIWWKMFNFVLFLKCWSQFNSGMVRTHFASLMTLNNCERIAETRSYILSWRSRCRRRHVCLSTLLLRSWAACNNQRT